MSEVDNVSARRHSPCGWPVRVERSAAPTPPLESSLDRSTTSSPTEEPAPSMDADGTHGMATFDTSWTGWAELENDPVIFTTLLREWGVANAQVQEVIPLDSVFEYPAESVFGLIFLSRWAPAVTVNPAMEPPPGVWFANQVSSFSCASVALMNVINNRPDLDLGPALNDFRLATSDASPKDRGIALDGFPHARDAHNSFATDLDKMSIDLRLKQEFAAAQRSHRATKTKKSRRKRKADQRASDEDTPGFHFVAYVPAAGSVWKMDGMERLPRLVGPLEPGDNWIALALPEMQTQLEGAGSAALEFSLLAVTAARTDVSATEADQAKVARLREDWGPFIAHIVRLHADRGDLRDALEGRALH